MQPCRADRAGERCSAERAVTGGAGERCWRGRGSDGEEGASGGTKDRTDDGFQRLNERPMRSHPRDVRRNAASRIGKF